MQGYYIDFIYYQLIYHLSGIDIRHGNSEMLVYFFVKSRTIKRNALSQSALLMRRWQYFIFDKRHISRRTAFYFDYYRIFSRINNSFRHNKGIDNISSL